MRDPNESNLTIGEMRRRAVKGQMQNAMSGNLVSDVEKQGFRKQAQGQADAVLGAQSTQLARQAMGGGQNAQAYTEQAQKVAEKSADAGVKASGQEKALTNQLREQRRAAAMGDVAALQQKRMQDAQMALDTWNQQSQAVAGIVQGIGDAVPG